MRQTKNVVSIVNVLLLLALIFVSACTSNSPNAQETAKAISTSQDSKQPAATDKPVQLSMTIGIGNDQAAVDTFNEIVKQYEGLHPNVKIKLEAKDVGQQETFRTWITTQLIGGIAPDIMSHQYIWDVEDLGKGLLTELTPFYKEKNPYADNQVWEDMFPKSVLQQLKGTGQAYASVPTTIDVIRILYNKDLFKKAGITTEPKTWNEFMAMQQKLLDAGVTPFGFVNSIGPHWSWSVRVLTAELIAKQYDAMDINKNGFVDINEYVKAVNEGVIDIEKSPYIDVFKFMKDWSKYWVKGYNGLDAATAQDMFLRQEFAMTFQTSGGSRIFFESNARKFEIGAFPLPYLTKENHPDAIEQLIELGGVPAGGFAIPKNIAANKLPVAIDFLKFLTSPKVQGLLGEKLYRTSVIKDAVLPDKLKSFKIIGQPMKLNIYGGEIDKDVTEWNVKTSQLFTEGRKTAEEHAKIVKEVMVKNVQKMMKDRGWSKENNYGIK